MDSFQTLLIVGCISLLLIVNVATMLWAFSLKLRINQKPAPKYINVDIGNARVLNDEDVASIRDTAAKELEQSVAASLDKVHTSIGGMMRGMDQKVVPLVADKLKQEIREYHDSLVEFRKKNIDDITNVTTELNRGYRQKIQYLGLEVEKEKQTRIDEFEQRMNDVVSSYIIESLDTNVDMSAQAAYIVSSLESKKEDIKRDLLA